MCYIVSGFSKIGDIFNGNFGLLFFETANKPLQPFSISRNLVKYFFNKNFQLFLFIDHCLEVKNVKEIQTCQNIRAKFGRFGRFFKSKCEGRCF